MNSFLRRALSGVCLAATLTLQACSSPWQEAPAADAPADTATPDATAMLSAAELRQDLDQLYATLQSAHYDLYARRDRASYDALHASLHARLDPPMSAEEARLALQRA